MYRVNMRQNRHSKKGITLVELIISMTLTAMFAVICVALMNPISRMYKGTVKITRAQLLADAIIDSIRKECDGLKTDESTTVWIAQLNETAEDDKALRLNGPEKKAPGGNGNTLVIQKNNNYAEAIYACLPISHDNYLAVLNNPVQGDKASHSIDRLSAGGSYDPDEPNVKKGIVHFGYYQAKEDKEGIFPFRAYDYTNPVLASAYGDFTVKLEFKDLKLKDDKYPSYCMCEVTVKENGKKVYSRTTVISFSANGSGQGHGGGGGGHSDNTKNVDVNIRWLESDGSSSTWPSGKSITITLTGANRSCSTTLSSGSKFTFGNVKLIGKPKLTSTEVEGYELLPITGNSDSGYYVTYKRMKVEKFKLVSGSYIKNKLGTETTAVIFGKYDDYKDQVEGISSLDFAVDINATNDNNRKSEYRYFRVGTTAYILSKDGTFVANEKCNEMFSGFTNLQSVTWPSGNAFNTSRVETMYKMFFNCSSMEQFNFPNKFVRSHCSNLESMLDGCTKGSSVRIKEWDTSGVEKMKKMFQFFGRNCVSSTGITINLSCFDFSNCIDISKIFNNYKDKNSDNTGHIVRIVFPEKIDFSKVTELDATFSCQTNLEVIEHFEKIKAPLAKKFSSVFYNCHRLGSQNSGKIDISGFEFESSTDFNGFFYGCTSMTSLKMNNCNFRQGTNFKDFFTGCDALTSVEIKDTNMSSCTSLEYFFSNCYNLRNVKISNFTTTSLLSCKGMFQNCYSLNISKGDISGWDTSSVTNMSFMFNHACYKGDSAYVSLKDAEIDISFMSFASVNTFEKMFNVDDKSNDVLKTVTLPSDTNAVTNADLVNLSGMFRRRHNLENINNLCDFSVTNAISNAQSMFSDSKCQILDIRKLDITKIPKGKAQWMFNESERLETIIVMADRDYSSFAEGNKNYEMFKDDYLLAGQDGTLFSVDNATKGNYARIDDRSHGTPGYFTSENYTPPEEPEP